MAERVGTTWRWTEDSPGAVVIVLLILFFALLFPRDACRGTGVPADGAPAAAGAEESGP